MEENYAEKNDALLTKLKQEITIREYSPKTKEAYLRYIEDFLNFSKKPAEATVRDDIVAFLATKKEKANLKATSLALIFSSLRFMLKDYLKMNIMDDVKLPKKAKTIPVVLSKEEIKVLINSEKKLRNRLILEFLYSSGCRVSEVVNFKKNDLSLQECIGRVIGGKGNKDRTIVLSKRWCEEFHNYVEDRSSKGINSDFVFCSSNGKQLSVDLIQLIVKNAAKRAGINKKVSPHKLRHSYATHMLESGENIRKIQELLGHANLNTTQIYTRVSVEELKKTKNPLDGL